MHSLTGLVGEGVVVVGGGGGVLNGILFHQYLRSSGLTCDKSCLVWVGVRSHACKGIKSGPIV